MTVYVYTLTGDDKGTFYKKNMFYNSYKQKPSNKYSFQNFSRVCFPPPETRIQQMCKFVATRRETFKSLIKRLFPYFSEFWMKFLRKTLFSWKKAKTCSSKSLAETTPLIFPSYRSLQAPGRVAMRSKVCYKKT